MQLDGEWACQLVHPSAPPQTGYVRVAQDGDRFTMTLADANGNPAMFGTQPFAFSDGRIDGTSFGAEEKVKAGPLPMKIVLQGEIEQDRLSGSIKVGVMGTLTFTATR